MSAHGQKELDQRIELQLEIKKQESLSCNSQIKISLGSMTTYDNFLCELGNDNGNCNCNDTAVLELITFKIHHIYKTIYHQCFTQKHTNRSSLQQNSKIT